MSTSVHLSSIGAEWLSTRAGGLNRYVAGLVGTLSQVADVDQCCLVMGDQEAIEADKLDIRCVARPDAGLLQRWRGMRRGFTESERPDVVATHFALYAFPLRRWLVRMPHVVHFHGPWAAESSAEGQKRLAIAGKRFIEKSVYRTGDRFITLSQAFADVLRKQYGVDPTRIRVIPGGVDLDRFAVQSSQADARNQLGWEADRPTVLCVRRLMQRMGLEQLVEAMRTVVQSHPEVRLKIAGKGPLTPTLEAAIDRYGLNKHVQLLGFVPDADLPLAYRAADLSVVPSQSLEGFGLIIPESLAAGTPALVTPVGGMPEVVRELSQDLILAGSSVADIAEGLCAALDGSLKLPDSETCQAYARKRFDWDVIAGQVLEVYREAIQAYE